MVIFGNVGNGRFVVFFVVGFVANDDDGDDFWVVTGCSVVTGCLDVSGLTDDKSLAELPIVLGFFDVGGADELSPVGADGWWVGDEDDWAGGQTMDEIIANMSKDGKRNFGEYIFLEQNLIFCFLLS